MIVTSPDSMGYKCCQPPVGLRITDQVKTYPQANNEGPRLPDAEVQATIDYLLAGHTVAEAAEYFGRHPSSIGHRMRAAGYSYDATRRCWGLG